MIIIIQSSGPFVRILIEQKNRKNYDRLSDIPDDLPTMMSYTTTTQQLCLDKASSIYYVDTTNGET